MDYRQALTIKWKKVCFIKWLVCPPWARLDMRLNPKNAHGAVHAKFGESLAI